MVDLFRAFDFRLLDDPEFREDSVREELVVPLLAALGYSASPPHRIIRSRQLQHPFVYIGTVAKPITIIPDYLLQRDGENAWILDAKSPKENIHTGKNVEQAYSYAIHKDIRVPLYALCNGRRLVVFDVSSWPAILDVSLPEVVAEWPQVLALLGSRAAWPEGRRPDFLPDMGLALRKAGLAVDADGTKIWQMFVSVPVQMVTKVQDDLYTLTGVYRQEDSAHMITFSFGPDKYEAFLDALPAGAAKTIRKGLKRQPYRVTLGGEAPTVTVASEPGDEVYTNEHESYCPFVAEEFIKDPSHWPDE